jgi:hypothetical protein
LTVPDTLLVPLPLVVGPNEFPVATVAPLAVSSAV